MRRLITAAAVIATMGAAPAVASAAGTTRYVVPPNTTVFGSNTGCNDPGYTSVQQAVNDSLPGDEVYLCGSTSVFAEQVIVNKSITLTGDSGAAISAPSSADSFAPLSDLASSPSPQAILVVDGTDATITGLTIEGPLPGNGGCGADEFGVAVINGGDATLSSDQVSNIRDADSSLWGCQFGVGIQVGRDYWETTGMATITNTTVSGYQKNGVTVDGSGSSATFTRDSVTGAGAADPMSSDIAQNGIQVSRGAAASIRGNLVSNNWYTGPAGATACGLLFYRASGVKQQGNTFSGNQTDVCNAGRGGGNKAA